MVDYFPNFYYLNAFAMLPTVPHPYVIFCAILITLVVMIVAYGHYSLYFPP